MSDGARLLGEAGHDGWGAVWLAAVMPEPEGLAGVFLALQVCGKAHPIPNVELNDLGRCSQGIWAHYGS